MRMKRILSMFLMLALMLTGLAGCQGEAASENPSESAAPVVNTEPTDEFVIYRPPYTPDWMSEAIMLFRQIYPDVKVTIEDFSTTGTYEERMAQYCDRVTNELLSGEGPDIIFPSYLNANIYKAMQGGIYLNLSPFFEQDKNFKEEDFLPGVFDAGKYQGRQYIVPIYVTYPAFLARTPVLESLGIGQVECGDTISFLRQLGEVSPLLDQNLELELMMHYTGFFGRFLEIANLKLIDYENRQICPNPETIRAFMEAYKACYKWDYQDGKFVSGRMTNAPPWLPVNYCYTWLYSEINHFRLYGACFQAVDGGYTDFILRDAEGRISTSYMYYTAVPASSKNQINAYRFIQILLSESIQARKVNYKGTLLYENIFCPVSKEALGLKVREQMNEPSIKFYDASYKTIGSVPALPAEALLGHMDQLLQAETSTLYDSTIITMTWDSMEPFFKDEKTYEACFDELKSKLTIYMDE